MSVNDRPAFRHRPQKSNGNRREDPQTLFDTGVHKGKTTKDFHVKVCFALNGATDLVRKLLEVVWIAEEIVR